MILYWCFKARCIKHSLFIYAYIGPQRQFQVAQSVNDPVSHRKTFLLKLLYFVFIEVTLCLSSLQAALMHVIGSLTSLSSNSIFWSQMPPDRAQCTQSYQPLLHMKLATNITVENSIERDNNCRCTVTVETWWRNWALGLMQYHLLNGLFVF